MSDCNVDTGPPVFIFENTQFQTAANAVYLAKQAYDAKPVNAAKNAVYVFKTDFERMQYKLGLYGRFPPAGRRGLATS
jgi:hypothetical protein